MTPTNTGRSTLYVTGFGPLSLCLRVNAQTWSQPMKVLVPVKRVIDYNVKPRVKADQTGDRK
ncbi:MAG: hypothetical protein AAFS13_07285, partial [Pseudomonadota bacterium]